MNTKQHSFAIFVTPVVPIAPVALFRAFLLALPLLFAAQGALAGGLEQCLCQKALAAAMCRPAADLAFMEAKGDAMRFRAAVGDSGAAGEQGVDYYCRASGDALTLASPVWARDTIPVALDAADGSGCRTARVPKTVCPEPPDTTCCPE
jgi:hypothetical protein